MSYPTGHEPSVNDGVEGLLVQITEAVQELAGGTGGTLTDTQLRASAVPTRERQFTASSSATVGTADGTVATLTAGQVLSLQNLDNDELYVKLGAGASTSSFTFIIPACTAANDGTVPPYLIDNWIGVVSVKAEADTAPRYLATVLS